VLELRCLMASLLLLWRPRAQIEAVDS